MTNNQLIKNKKIFLTGGAGFIASALISRLYKHNEIVIYDNFKRDTYSTSSHFNHKNIKVVKGDVLDFDNVNSSMKGASIVIHAAAIAGIDTVIIDPTLTMRVNMIGTANVLEAAKQNNVKGRVIDFSTSEVFGSQAFKSSEEDATITGSAGHVRWIYAVSKLAGEHLGLAYHSQYKLPVTCVRPFNIYGPGQTGEGAIQIFIKRALKNEDLNIYGDGNQIRAWCFVEDFVDCLLLCITKKQAIGQSINIGNSRAVMTTYGLAQAICRILNSKSKIVFKPPLSEEIELRIPSVEKAKSLLNFQSKIDLEEGILKTAEWIEKNLK